MRIFLAIPSYAGLMDEHGAPRCAPFMQSLAATITAVERAGHDVVPIERSLFMGCCYIQVARNELVREFRQDGADRLLFLDDDLSWPPEAALRLIETPGPVVAGLYRYKTPVEDYPVAIHTDARHRPIVREADGALWASQVPTGFLSITREAIEQLCARYPERAYRKMVNGHATEGYVDLFPQGIEGGQWVGEDYAFCRLWERMGGDIWVVPDLDLTHHGRGTAYPGNYHHFMLRQPGGRAAPPLALERATEILGYLTLGEAEWLATEGQGRACIVEIGSAWGRSTRAMADNLKDGAVLYALDDWHGPRESVMTDAERTGLYDAFERNLKDHIDTGRVVPIVCDHAAPPAALPAPDMVFIDGDHTADAVARDITTWRARLAPGGLLCGHDAGMDGVAAALRALLPDAELVPLTALWAWRKP